MFAESEFNIFWKLSIWLFYLFSRSDAMQAADVML